MIKKIQIRSEFLVNKTLLNLTNIFLCEARTTDLHNCIYEDTKWVYDISFW